MMQQLRTRLILEWQELDIQYPLWLTHIVLDELYYVIAIVVMSLVCFSMGMIMGFIVAAVI